MTSQQSLDNKDNKDNDGLNSNNSNSNNDDNKDNKDNKDNEVLHNFSIHFAVQHDCDYISSFKNSERDLGIALLKYICKLNDFKNSTIIEIVERHGVIGLNNTNNNNNNKTTDKTKSAEEQEVKTKTINIKTNKKRKRYELSSTCFAIDVHDDSKE